MYHKIFAILFTTTITACSSFESQRYHMTQNSMKITVIESKYLGPRIRGKAIIGKDHCLILLKEYPHCLGHEVMHCLGGYWHGNTPNEEFCD